MKFTSEVPASTIRSAKRIKVKWFFLFAAVAAMAFQLGDISSVSANADQSAALSASITATPLTWNIVGLDSNSPATGPNRFPVGTRICNTGTTSTGIVTATYVWDSANAYIALRSGSLSTINVGPIAAGSCADAYFEVDVDKTAGLLPFNTARKYRITATDALSGSTAGTLTGRELYVERLISQNRNGVDFIKLNGATIPAGAGMTLVVGNTYTIELGAHTATQGYSQLEGFINFPNTIFQTLGVSTTYTANTSAYVTSPNDKMYANACLWDENLNSPNYRSCVGSDGKTGGTIVTTYTVKILSGGGTSQSLNSLLYDFSGSSFHYNSDYSVGARIANIVSPASVAMNKTFTPKAITPGGTSAMTFKISNPTSEAFTGVNFTDSFPSGLQVAATPGISYSGCGSGAFSPVPTSGATSLAFSGGSLAANGTCTISVNVTALAGTYVNTTGNLFINTSTDTGNFGQDTLTAVAAAACTPGQTLATWTMPLAGQGSGGPPPPFTTKASNVTSATATSVGATSSVISTSGNPTNAWGVTGFPKNAVVNGDSTPYMEFALDTSKFSGVGIALDYFRDTSWGSGSDVPTMYVYSSTSGLAGSYSLIYTALMSLPSSWQPSGNVAAATTGSAVTYFRITAKGANNTNSSQLFVDNISMTGCGLPVPPPTISKAFTPATIVKGAVSTLSFTINNTATGNQALTGIAFTDVMPAGLSIATASVAACAGTLATTAGTRTITLTGGSLAAGGSCTFSVPVTGTTEGRYDNITGYISSNESGTSTNYATSTLTVVAPPSLGKAFSPASLLTGSTSGLAFTITNPNQFTALTGMGFTDALPAGMTIGTSGPTSTCGGSLSTAPNTITLTGATLAAKATCTFSVTVTGASSGSKLNTTSVITSTEGGNGAAATATLVVSNAAAVLDLNKQISKDGVNWFKFVGVAVGANVYYRFTAYNGGDVPFSAISVTDPTLAGTSADPASCVWTTPLAVGDTAYCVKGPVAAVSGTRINTATAQGTWASGTATSSPSTATYATTALTIAKNATENYFLAAGNVLHYSFVVTNTGFAPLLGPVTVADDKSNNETCPAVNTIGDLDDYLDAGESITCTATYVVQAADVTARSVTNLASATIDGTTSNTASKTITLGTDLAISKSSSPKAYVAGSSLTYTIIVTNNGPSAVTQATVSDTLPAALSSFTWTCTTAGSGASCGTSGPVTGDINALVDLPVGTQAVFTVSGTVPLATTGTINNTASVSTPSGIVDVIPGNNSATDSNGAGTSADLAIRKTSSPKPYVAGSALTYTITVSNSGPSSVTGATVVDSIPSTITGVTWTSSITGTAAVTSGATGSGNSLSATLNIGPAFADKVIFTVTGTVPADTTGGISNTATVTPPTGTNDPVPGNNTATDNNATGSQADLTITKTSTPTVYVAGSPLTYTIVVSNVGPTDAIGARVQDALPSPVSGFTWSCSSSGAGTCLRASGTGDIDALVDLPSGTNVTFTVSGTVPAGTVGALINTATVTPPVGLTDTVEFNNSATAGNAPTAAGISISGRVLTSDGRGLRNAFVTLTDSQGMTLRVLSSSFGYYSFADVPAGETYIIGVASKRFHYTPRVIFAFDDLTEPDFVPDE